MAESRPANFKERLSEGPDWLFALVAITAAFSTYFCMYAFRKPFSAATFEGLSFMGTAVTLKTALVISQLLGYTLSKFVGIKVCSEALSRKRGAMLIMLILIAEAALLLFGLLPGEWKLLAIFLNGVPLGMVWGLVVSYLEGRKTSDLLLAGLACSFIVASGVVKDVGRWLMRDHGFTEFWMPFATGLIFLIPFFISVWLLEQLPQPTAEDRELRSERTAMDRAQRWAFIKAFAGSLTGLIVFYLLLTAFRDYRDNYGVELFTELGYGEEPTVFSRSETMVAVGVMVTMALLNLIKDNRKGFYAAFAVMGVGMACIGVATWLLQSGSIDGLTWMVLTGLGSYLAYVPFNTILFERMMAYTRFGGTAVFAIYLADAAGYSGSVVLQLFKDLFEGQATRLEFFVSYSYGTAVLGIVLMTVAFMLVRGDEKSRL